MLVALALALALETRGVVELEVEGQPVEKRFVLRHPEAADWNGKLVIGAHGGSGGQSFTRDGRVRGTDETALDDVIGAHALDSGFAYASVDRDGIGGTRERLDLTVQFTGIVEELDEVPPGSTVISVESILATTAVSPRIAAMISRNAAARNSSRSNQLAGRRK